MKKRMVLMLIAVAVFVTAIGAVKYGQIKKGMAEQANFVMPAEAVTTVIAKSQEWPATLSATGSVAAVHGVVVSADLPGVVEKISFESGRMARQGDLLVQLDTRQELAQLRAAEAQKELAKLTVERYTGLTKTGILAQADWDKADADLKSADAKIGEIKATIARKTIRAPFTGLLGIRQVNLGQYLEAGAPIVPLQSLDPIYVNFSVPQQDAARLTNGIQVKVRAENAGTEATGKLTATDSLINEATRNVQVQATFANPQGRLRPGMYVTASVSLGSASTIIPLPASAINYAPYGDSVYVVEDMKDPKGQTYKGVRQQFVKLGPGRGDQIAVLEGLKPGQEIVTSGVFKLRQGASVQVNNKTVPSNSPAPKPEDS
jgi:membrane fusion protein (multidrug efflux system)